MTIHEETTEEWKRRRLAELAAEQGQGGFQEFVQDRRAAGLVAMPQPTRKPVPRTPEETQQELTRLREIQRPGVRPLNVAEVAKGAGQQLLTGEALPGPRYYGEPEPRVLTPSERLGATFASFIRPRPIPPEELADWLTAPALAVPPFALATGGLTAAAREAQGVGRAVGQTARRAVAGVQAAAGKPQAALRTRFGQAAAKGLAGAQEPPVKQPTMAARKALKTEPFFVQTPSGWKPVEGRPVTFQSWPGEQFFVHRDIGAKTWVVSEARTGANIVSGELTPTKAIEAARTKMATMAQEQYRGTYLSAKEGFLRRYGESPRFVQQQPQARAAEVARGQAEMPITKPLPETAKPSVELRVGETRLNPTGLGQDAPVSNIGRYRVTKLGGDPLSDELAVYEIRSSSRPLISWALTLTARPGLRIEGALLPLEREGIIGRNLKEPLARIQTVFTQSELRQMLRTIADDFPAAKAISGLRETTGHAEHEALINLTLFRRPQAAVTKLLPETARPAVQPPIGKPTEAVAAQAGRAWETGAERPFAFDPNSTANQGRFRLLPPIKGGSYITRQSGTPGVSYIVDTEANAIQAVRFNKAQFTEPQAAQWWEANRARLGRPTAQPGPVAVSRQPAPSVAEGPPPTQAVAPGGVPPTKPPVKPPTATGDIPPVEPVLPRPRTLNDMNREAKGMRAMTPEQRAAVMDVAKPIVGDVVYKARPFNEHAANLLGPDTGFMKALRAVPGVKQTFGAWNPAAMARDNPVAMIGLRQSIFQEIEKSRVRFATLRWWNDADDAFGFKRSGTAWGLKPVSGIWRATKVRPSSASVERGKMFGTMNDIIEHPERYVLDDAQKKVLALADSTLTQSVRDAQRAGVNVVELAEAYWPRAVIKGPKGEKGFAGIRRRVSGAKGYTHQRVFADVDDLVKAGFEVETDPRRVFAARLEAGIDTIAQANARKQIAALPGVEKPLERMARKFPETLKSANQARAARDAAKVTVVRAGTKATPEQVMALRQAEADYITAMREVFAKKVEAGAPGYYELRLPSGRIAPQELVEKVGKFIDLPELRQGATGGAARLTQEVSQLLRTTLTNVDLAAGYIQGQALFYRNNVAWWKSQGMSITALIDDPTAWVAKNFDLIDEGVRMGAIVAPTEFLFAKQGVASIPLRIPYAGPALGSFNRAFEWFITAGQTELYKAAKSGVAKNAGIEELVSLGSAIRKEVGTESYAILGIRANQRTMEALSLFAARFFRATVGVLGQSFTRGPGGAEARKAVGGLIAGGTALLIGIKWAQDKKLPNMTDPYAPDWMQFRIGNTYFNTYGPFYPYFRTLARMGVSLADGDAMKAGTEAKRFLTSKESLPLRAIDIAGQLMYYGSANVYGTKIEKTWASIAKGILSEFVTPISIQEIPSGIAEGRPESALETVGLIGRPVRVASEWAKDLQPYFDIPPEAEAKTKGLQTREAYRGAHPDVEAKLFITGQVDSLQTPDALQMVVTLMKQYGIRTQDIKSLQPKEFEDPRAGLRQYLQQALGEVLSPQAQGQAPAGKPTLPRQPTPEKEETTEEWRKRRLAEIAAQATPVPAGAR